MRLNWLFDPGNTVRFLDAHSIRRVTTSVPLKSSADGHIVKVLEGRFALHTAANLVLRQGRFGMFIGCSNYPECEHTELIDKPDETAITCPQCRTGHLVQRRSRYGKTFHSCDRYPECQFAINFKPIAGECPECHYPPLIEKKPRRCKTLLCQ